jgi:hypothetical protein
VLDRVIATLAIAMFDWLERRIAKGNTAIDADKNIPLLRRGGERIRIWLRQQDNLHSRSKSDQDRT